MNVLFLQKGVMNHHQIITCPHCNGANLMKNGHSETGTQRWFCNLCRKSFQLDYSYNAWKPGVKAKISEMAMNGSGVRDTGRILKIAPRTVTSEFKKNAARESLCT